jgi:hypothetical protein
MVSLFLVGNLNIPSVHADTTFQICVNGKCEIVSDYEGYQNKNTCVNEDCSPEIPTNSSIHELN